MKTLFAILGFIAFIVFYAVRKDRKAQDGKRAEAELEKMQEIYKMENEVDAETQEGLANIDDYFDGGVRPENDNGGKDIS